MEDEAKTVRGYTLAEWEEIVKRDAAAVDAAGAEVRRIKSELRKAEKMLEEAQELSRLSGYRLEQAKALATHESLVPPWCPAPVWRQEPLPKALSVPPSQRRVVGVADGCIQIWGTDGRPIGYRMNGWNADYWRRHERESLGRLDVAATLTAWREACARRRAGEG
jgi:hypothetical protein